ncbi:MAG: transporter substrate-binding domain-containing protein [Bacteroidota bacterium]
MSKSIIIIILNLCFILPFSSQAQQISGDTWSSVKSKGGGKIKVSFVETPGFVYREQSGRLTGICVDLMKDFVAYLSESKGVKVDIEFVGNGDSFRGMYNRVKGSKGGVFGLGNITITDARKKEIKFSSPFIKNLAVLISQNQVPTLNNLSNAEQNFKGLTAYTPKGTTNEKRVLELKNKYFSSLNVVQTSSSPETLEKVIGDKNGLAYLDIAFYLDALKRKKPLKRHPAGDKGGEEFGIIMPMNSDWQPVLNEFMAANGGYTQSTNYKKIIIKHLGQTGAKFISQLR